MDITDWLVVRLPRQGSQQSVRYCYQYWGEGATHTQDIVMIMILKIISYSKVKVYSFGGLEGRWWGGRRLVAGGFDAMRPNKKEKCISSLAAGLAPLSLYLL